MPDQVDCATFDQSKITPEIRAQMDADRAAAELIHRPAHYTSRGGPECVTVIEAWGLCFHAGNALKYIYRAGMKADSSIERDFRKSIWYLERELDSDCWSPRAPREIDWKAWDLGPIREEAAMQILLSRADPSNRNVFIANAITIIEGGMPRDVAKLDVERSR